MISPRKKDQLQYCYMKSKDVKHIISCMLYYDFLSLKKAKLLHNFWTPAPKSKLSKQKKPKLFK